jgi:hypothetical protein
MTNYRNRLTGLRSLNAEIHRLQGHKKALENKIDAKMEFLQSNYSSMVMKSVFPAIQDKAGVPFTVVELLTQNERIRGSVGRVANLVLNKLSDGLDFIADKLEKNGQ